MATPGCPETPACPEQGSPPCTFRQPDMYVCVRYAKPSTPKTIHGREEFSGTPIPHFVFEGMWPLVNFGDASSKQWHVPRLGLLYGKRVPPTRYTGGQHHQ